jgi:hypothetical protein
MHQHRHLGAFSTRQLPSISIDHSAAPAHHPGASLPGSPLSAPGWRATSTLPWRLPPAAQDSTGYAPTSHLARLLIWQLHSTGYAPARYLGASPPGSSCHQHWLCIGTLSELPYWQLTSAPGYATSIAPLELPYRAAQDSTGLCNQHRQYLARPRQAALTASERLTHQHLVRCRELPWRLTRSHSTGYAPARHLGASHQQLKHALAMHWHASLELLLGSLSTAPGYAPARSGVSLTGMVPKHGTGLGRAPARHLGTASPGQLKHQHGETHTALGTAAESCLTLRAIPHRVNLVRAVWPTQSEHPVARGPNADLERPHVDSTCQPRGA